MYMFSGVPMSHGVSSLPRKPSVSSPWCKRNESKYLCSYPMRSILLSTKSSPLECLLFTPSPKAKVTDDRRSKEKEQCDVNCFSLVDIKVSKTVYAAIQINPKPCDYQKKKRRWKNVEVFSPPATSNTRTIL